MNKNRFITLCSAFVIAAGTLFAQTPAQETSVLNWSNAAKKELKDGGFNVVGRKNLITAPFNVDPAKTYTFTATFRSPNATPKSNSRLYVSFIPAKANGRTIASWNNFALPGTFTTLTANAKKGDTVLKVKDGSKFQFLSYACIVFNAKADFSDLPNSNMLANAITGKVQKQGYWELTLKKPLIHNAAAGTAIRQHRHGGFLYPQGSRILKKDWITVKASITGTDPGANWINRHWPVGTKKAMGALLILSQDKALITEIKDISLTVK